jgi:hypothetical protein
VGLITGGKIADSLGWRWTKRVPACASAIIFVLFIIGFEETMFPRFLFNTSTLPTVASRQSSNVGVEADEPKDHSLAVNGSKDMPTATVNFASVQDNADLAKRFPRRSYLQMLKPWSWVPEDKMSFFDYFK